MPACPRRSLIVSLTVFSALVSGLRLEQRPQARSTSTELR